MSSSSSNPSIARNCWRNLIWIIAKRYSGTYVDQDESSVSIVVTKYRGMVGYLLYLRETRPDIKNPKESHIATVKRIMKYLKGTTNVGLWYTKGNICYLVGYSDSDYAGYNTDHKSTGRTCHILGNRLVWWLSCSKICPYFFLCFFRRFFFLFWMVNLA